METWNKRLAQAFAESGYSANKLAGEVGVSAPTFAAWIGAASIKPAQDITAANLFRVCKLLKVRPEWVLFSQPPKSSLAETDKSLPVADKLPLRPSDVSTESVKVPSGQIDEFVADLKMAWKDDRLTRRRFALLRELLHEGTESPVGSLEQQQISTRVGHVRRGSRSGKGGTG